jgi:hypothetical protein
MSSIFVLVGVALTLLIGAIVFNTAAGNSGSSAAELDSIVDILGTGLEVGALLPIALFLGLFAAVLGVWARI